VERQLAKGVAGQFPGVCAILLRDGSGPSGKDPVNETGRGLKKEFQALRTSERSAMGQSAVEGREKGPRTTRHTTGPREIGKQGTIAKRHASAWVFLKLEQKIKKKKKKKWCEAMQAGRGRSRTGGDNSRRGLRSIVRTPTARATWLKGPEYRPEERKPTTA